MNSTLSERLQSSPERFDPKRGERVAEAFAATLESKEIEFLARVASNSPYLTRLMLREAEFLRSAMRRPPEDVLSSIRTQLDANQILDRDAMLTHLREGKRQAALLIALCDLGGVWSLNEVCEALTAFADDALTAALRFVLRDATNAGRWRPRNLARPEEGGGLFFLAMGKHGARELNYSSDIDFSCYFEPSKLPLGDGVDAKPFAVRVTQMVVGLMQDLTPDGYVFRCDLRMRPDAGSTQIAMSLEAAENYYETMGQNWERAAMIKARACAGDIAEGEAYLKRLSPFIWRKYLDYAAIADIHSIKRQIHAHGAFGKIALAGHNIKLGRGGIREIEFFAQTQQLIMGGRDPRLRERTTLGALDALTVKGVVKNEVLSDLSAAYVFLRTLEHRLQMIDDEQTHSLPKDKPAIDNVARFMGDADTVVFEQRLLKHLQCVHEHYGRLFESAPPLSETAGSLVFTGVDDDAETIATLRSLGFSQPSAVAATIRGWHHGRIRATRSERARERLTALMPLLLKSLGESANPDLAFTRFDKFLVGLPSGVQVFALLYSNPHLLRFIADIVGTAPRLADHLAKRPGLFDALTDPDFLTHRPDRAALTQLLAEALGHAETFEDKLDAARRWAQDQQFRVGLQLLEGNLDGAEAGRNFSRIAETVICALYDTVERDAIVSHGRIANGAMVIAAMGKLGGEEMTATSDLDLVFVYEHAADATVSDGPKPLQPGPYFARISQRLITALTTLTSEGGLYDVDMRLRPSGNKGPVAVSLESFTKYQRDEAWTWERMALTRARVIAGPKYLAARVEKAIVDALTVPRNRHATLKDVSDMRARMEHEQGPCTPWQIKEAPGGLIDIEFIVQGLTLANAYAHREIIAPGTRNALTALRDACILTEGDAVALLEAFAFYENVMQLLRLTHDEAFTPPDAAPGLRALLCRAAHVDEFDAIEQRLRAFQSEVRGRFEKYICGH